MPRMLGWLRRFWVTAVIVLALVAAVSVVGRLRTFFDTDKPYIAASMPADDIKPINTKRVTYEIVGPADASGRVSYLDVNGKTMEASFRAAVVGDGEHHRPRRAGQRGRPG